MREIAQTAKFKRDLKRVRAGVTRQVLVDLDDTITLLAEDAMLPERLQDHPLKGVWEPARECHIRPDILLVYRKQENELTLVRLGSHAELFE